MARILVVDDHRDLVETTAHLFESLGHETRIALDGRQALERAATFEPELVFMDLDMPVMTGYEAARHLVQQPHPRPRLIAVTASAQADVIDLAKQAGFDSVLVKPVEFNTLLFLVQALTRDAG